MKDTIDLSNLPWQALQRRLADAFSDESVVYSDVRGKAQSHWKRSAAQGSWYARTRVRTMGMTSKY